MDLARYIDHTLLRADATADDIKRLCEEALEYRFYSVVVNPIWVKTAIKELRGSGVSVGSVAGFPLGASLLATKLEEARRAEADGASEIDVVADIGQLMEEKSSRAAVDLAVIRSGLQKNTVLKVIIETPLLPEDLWPPVVEAVIASGAEFVKSATGFAGPTPVEHIKKLKALTGDRIRIKAAGGIKTIDQARAMIDAGADRIGSSSSVAIVTGKM